MATRHTQTQTPLSSPCLGPSTQPILIQDLQKVLVEINKVISKVSDSFSLFKSLDQIISGSSESD
jgi:hypothetical protein